MKSKIAMLVDLPKMPKNCRVCGVFGQCGTIDRVANATAGFYNLETKPKECPLRRVNE